MKQLVLCDHIYTERGCIDGGFVIEDGKFRQIFMKPQFAKEFDGKVHDYRGHRIIPGMIELHIHGFKGWSAMMGDKQQILGLSDALVSEGITTYTPTNHYCDEVFENNLVIAEVMSEPRKGAKILGIHMEGPFISKEKLGSVLEEEVKAPSIELMNRYLESANNKIVTVTMAPEVEGGMEMVDYLAAKGINVCLGHTNATYDQAIEAIDRGAVISQKTGNCMRGMHHREMGVLGAVMLDRRIYNEVNSDMAHVTKPFVEMLYRLKGYEKLCIVADEGVMSGMKKGKYELPDRGTYYVGPDTLLHIADQTIDGSIYSMRYGLRNWVEVMKVPMEEAVVMASLNPAKVLKRDHELGSIREGKCADFAVIDERYEVIATYVDGEMEYHIHDGREYANTEMYEYLVEEFD